jgi:predicted  nucleic acid-binding Zn-ribbon protein
LRQNESASEQLLLLATTNEKLTDANNGLRRQVAALTAATAEGEKGDEAKQKAYQEAGAQAARVPSLEAEIAELNEQLAPLLTLKPRAMKIAAELKEKRALTESLAATNSTLSINLKAAENVAAALTSSNAQLKSDLDSLKQSHTSSSQSSDTLAASFEAYKTKAQQALKSANDRTADARASVEGMKSKVEEMERRVKAAEEAAESALIKALEGEKAMDKFDALSEELEKANERAKASVAARDVAVNEAKSVQESLAASESSLNALQSDHESLFTSHAGALTAHSSELADRDAAIRDLEAKVKDLRAAAAAQPAPAAAATVRLELEAAREKIASLEQQLLEATASSTSSSSDLADQVPPAASQPESATPLFFALTKQNELSIAQNEITRLASKISDVTTSHAEALELVETLQAQLLQAESALERHSTAELSVNVEYLKNVLLQYFTAQSGLERSRLLPVIAAVISFTPAELAQSQAAVDQGMGVRGIGGALVDGISNAKNSEGGLVGGLGGLVGGLIGRSPARR